MNSSQIKFPSSCELKLHRSAPGTAPSLDDLRAVLTKGQCRLAEDTEALCVREENLRAYEAHLRAMQEQLGDGKFPTLAPKPVSGASSQECTRELEMGWSKVHRARELLENEQRQLRRVRMSFDEERAALLKREATVAAREARVAEREALIPKKEPVKQGVFGFTKAPFSFGRTVFTKS